MTEPSSQAALLPTLVLDTNTVLALWMFRDPALETLRAWIDAGSCRLVSRADALEELRRVLAYAQFGLDPDRQDGLRTRYLARIAVLANDADAGTLPGCRDPDDQKFLEIAGAAGMATLITRDKVNAAGFVEQAEVTKLAEEYAAKLRVKTPNLQERVENLSGGNQQKLLIARWLLTNPKILILDEPTRGIDVGAKAEIHRLITQLAGQGVAVLMISSELPEVLGMSDRIMVMHEGHVSGFLNRDEADQVRVMELAAK